MRRLVVFLVFLLPVLAQQSSRYTIIPYTDNTGTPVSTGFVVFRDLTTPVGNASNVAFTGPDTVVQQVILSATSANPMVLTLDGQPPITMQVGQDMDVVGATGTGCSTMNGPHTVTNISGATITISYNGTGCTYNASSGHSVTNLIYKLPGTNAVGPLCNDGRGNLTWGSCGGGGGGVAGSDTWIQYNHLGVFGADTNLKWDYTNQNLAITGESFLTAKSSAAPALFIKNAASGSCSAGNGVMQVADKTGAIVFQILCSTDPNDPSDVVTQGVAPGVDNTYDSGDIAARWRTEFIGTQIDMKNWVMNTAIGGNQIDATNLGGAFQIRGSSTSNGQIVLSPGAVVSQASVLVNAGRIDTPAFLVQQTAGNMSGGVFQVLDSGGGIRFQILGSADANPDVVVTRGVYPGADNLYSLGKNLTQRWATIFALRGQFDGTLTSNLELVANAGNSTVPAAVFQNAPSGTCTTGVGVLQLLDHSGNTVFQVLCSTDALHPNVVVTQGVSPGVDNLYDSGTSSSHWKTEHIATSIDMKNWTMNSSAAGPQIDATSLASSFKINGASSTDGRIILSPGGVASLAGVLINAGLTNTPAFIVKQTPGNMTGGVFQIQDSGGTVKFQILGTADANHDAVVFAGSIFPGSNLGSDVGSSADRWGTVWTGNLNISGTCTGCSSGVTAVATASPISGGTITSSGTISCPTCVDTASTQTITGSKTFNPGITVGGNITPTANAAFDLGSPSVNFRILWVNQAVVANGMTVNGGVTNLNAGLTVTGSLTASGFSGVSGTFCTGATHAQQLIIHLGVITGVTCN